MEYILFFMIVTGDDWKAEPVTDNNGNLIAYASADECFEAREKIVYQLGRPIINYQATCVLRSGEKFAKRYND